MFEPTEDEIRIRAYAIWESEGRPEGKHEEHWHRACEEAQLLGLPSVASDNVEASRSIEVWTKEADLSATEVLQVKRGVDRTHSGSTLQRLRDGLTSPKAPAARLLLAFARLLWPSGLLAR